VNVSCYVIYDSSIIGVLN